MLAYDYPLLGMFWTVIWVFLWVAWIVLLFRVFVDIFRSHDMGGWAKALWCLLVLFLPFLGVLIYLIARGGKMRDRDMADAAAQQQAFQSYVRTVATDSSAGTADELAKITQLRDQGVLTQAEWEQQKAKLLA